MAIGTSQRAIVEKPIRGLEYCSTAEVVTRSPAPTLIVRGKPSGSRRIT